LRDITYCSKTDCEHTICIRNQARAPKQEDISIADFSLDCKVYLPVTAKRKDLLQAVCYGTQNTAYYCNDDTKVLCGAAGACAYCATIADAIEEVLK
jgi:hypothetical protein